MSEVEEAGADGRARSLTHLPPSLLPFARGPAGAGAALLVYPPSFSPPSVRPSDRRRLTI